MEFIGTQFNLTLGGWRLRFSFAIEEAEDGQPPAAQKPPHRLLYKKPNQSHRVG
jgi:hypothetical protein